jgi:putative flavoprotein involved in K+ transport
MFMLYVHHSMIREGETGMEETFDCIVISAGQAGLAAAYHLQKQHIKYLILDASEQTAGSWPN